MKSQYVQKMQRATVGDVVRAGSPIDTYAQGSRGKPKQLTEAQLAAAQKAQRTLGNLANKGELDQVRLTALSFERQQTIPTREQIIEQGGGIGGYLKAYRKLNG